MAVWNDKNLSRKYFTSLPCDHICQLFDILPIRRDIFSGSFGGKFPWNFHVSNISHTWISKSLKYQNFEAVLLHHFNLPCYSWLHSRFGSRSIHTWVGWARHKSTCLLTNHNDLKLCMSLIFYLTRTELFGVRWHFVFMLVFLSHVCLFIAVSKYVLVNKMF